WRSASKRATTSRVSIPGLMSFKATLRPLHGVDQRGDGAGQEAVRPDIRSQQRFDRSAERRVAGAYLLQIRRTLLREGPGQRFVEDLFFSHSSPRGQPFLPPPFYARKCPGSTRILGNFLESGRQDWAPKPISRRSQARAYTQCQSGLLA